MIDQARTLNDPEAAALFYATPRPPPLPGDGAIVHGTKEPEPWPEGLSTYEFLWGRKEERREVA